jgi:hypothetical protein
MNGKVNQTQFHWCLHDGSISETDKGLCEIYAANVWEISRKYYSACWHVQLLLLLFMLMEWDYISELQPPTGLLFIPQVIYEYREPQWNDIDRGKPKNSEINLSQGHFVCHRSHMDWPRHEPGPLQWSSEPQHGLGMCNTRAYLADFMHSNFSHSFVCVCVCVCVCV